MLRGVRVHGLLNHEWNPLGVKFINTILFQISRFLSVYFLALNCLLGFLVTVTFLIKIQRDLRTDMKSELLIVMLNKYKIDPGKEESHWPSWKVLAYLLGLRAKIPLCFLDQRKQIFSLYTTKREYVMHRRKETKSLRLFLALDWYSDYIWKLIGVSLYYR